MITWVSTDITSPESEREIIVKNSAIDYSNKLNLCGSFNRCTEIRYYNEINSDEDIQADLLKDGFTLWQYVG
ncbi:MAG: hypothetical protein QM500_14445 [Methylococcales bacterium]